MGKSNPAEGSQKRTREDRVSDEAYFDANPNAARFREMARTLLAEPGATREGVQQALKKDFGVDEETLGRIFHLQQEEPSQADAGASEESIDLEQKKQEALSALIEERKKGNKGAKILKDLKKLGLPEEEIAEIDRSAGEPGKRTRKAQAQDPAFVDTQPEGKEENLRRNAAYILQERAQGKGDDAIAAEIRDGGWDEDEMAEMFEAANNAAEHMPIQALAASSEETSRSTQPEGGTGRTRGERPPRFEDHEVIRRDAFRLLKDRETGKTDKEITKLMEEAGLPPEAISRRFSMAETIAKSKEKKALQQNIDAVIWGRQAKMPEEEIVERLKSVGWKDEAVRKMLLLADQRPLPEQFELPEFEMAKRYFDPLRKYLMTLVKDPKNNFRIGDARPRYGIGLAPEAEKEGAKTRWTSVTNFHDFMRRIWDMPEAERARLRTTLFTDKPFQNRMDDEKDPLHAYKKEWERLVGRAVRPRSESERFPDDYARAAWRGDVYLEVPQENWDELAHNADVLPVPGMEALPPEVNAPAGFEVSESDLLNGPVFDADLISEAFRLETEEQQAIDENIATRHASAVDTRPAENIPVVFPPEETDASVDAHAVHNPYRPDLVEQAEEDDRIEVPKPKEGLSIAEVAENRAWNDRVDHIEHLRQLKDELEAELEHTTDETTREHLIRSLEEARRQHDEALAERLGAEQAARDQERKDVQALSDEKTTPYDEYGELIADLPDEKKTAYWRLEDALQEAIKSGDKAAQQQAMTSLDTFVAEQRRLAEAWPRKDESAPATAEERSDQWLIDKELAAYRKDGWVQDMPPVEGTPKEWHERLKSLIETAKEGAAATKEKAKGAAAATKEKVQWWKSAEAGLIRRREELDAEGEKFGWVEGKFRALGERYNKLGWKTKLAVGAALGLGAVASAASFPTALVFISGIATQRVAGLSTMYLKFEKSMLDKEGETRWTKEKAMSKALLYTVAFGLAEKEAITLASESSIGQATQRWLADHWPFGSHGHTEGISKPEHGAPGAASAPATSASHPVGTASAIPEAVTHPATAASAAPVQAEAATQPAAAASAPEANHAGPAEAAPAAPAIAPAESGSTLEIPKVDVAASKGHGYEYMAKRLWEQLQEKHIALPANANPDSDLARLLAADDKTIDSIVHKLAQEHEFYKADGHSAVIGLDSHMTIDSDGNISVDGAETAQDEVAGAAPEAPAANTAAKPDLPAAQSPAQPTPSLSELTPTDAGSATGVAHVDAAAGASPVEVGAQQVAPVTDHDFLVNKYEVTIPIASPNLYKGGENLFVYGGSAAEQAKMMLDYLAKHPTEVVLSSDDTGKYRVPWHLEAGKLVPGSPLVSPGFLGLGKTFLPPPGPDEFFQMVK